MIYTVLESAPVSPSTRINEGSVQTYDPDACREFAAEMIIQAIHYATTPNAMHPEWQAEAVDFLESPAAERWASFVGEGRVDAEALQFAAQRGRDALEQVPVGRTEALACKLLRFIEVCAIEGCRAILNGDKMRSAHVLWTDLEGVADRLPDAVTVRAWEVLDADDSWVSSSAGLFWKKALKKSREDRG